MYKLPPRPQPHPNPHPNSPGQNDRYFVGDIVICIFVNEKFCIFIEV